MCETTLVLGSESEAFVDIKAEADAANLYE